MSNKKNDKATSWQCDKKLKWLAEVPLGDALRKQYQSTVDEELPEKLKQLIEDLRRKETEL